MNRILQKDLFSISILQAQALRGFLRLFIWGENNGRKGNDE